LGYSERALRRLALPLALVAALATAASASSALQPVRRHFGDRTLPLLRHGTLRIPPGQASGRVRVIVTLRQPPLAVARGPGLFGRGGGQRLDVQSRSSRRYLVSLKRAQAAAVTSLRRAIPAAHVSRRFQVVLNGLTVELPVRRLTTLTRLSFVQRIYPSVRYRLTTNESAALTGAPALWAATGARGDGVKIAVVDDGVDQTHPFFSPTGYTYPAGYPKGAARYTTPKVIVARAFPGPGSGRRGRLPLDRSASFHGTHVAGIAAGNFGTTSPGGRSHPPVANLSGVAPRAYLGNYRIFNVPTRIGNVANTPEIVAAFEAAVRDGMDVINLSGGSSESDPTTDAMIETTNNVAAAGVLPVIAAGNARDEFGMGTVGSPGTASEALTVAAVSNVHVFGPTVTVQDARAPATLRQIPFNVTVLEPAFTDWERADRTLADVGSIVGTDGRPVGRRLCGITHPNALDTTLPRGSLSGSIALVSRGGCAIVTKALRAQLAGAIGMVMADNRSGEANGIAVELPVPGGMVSDLDGARLRDFLASVGGRAAVRFNFNPLETKTGRSGIVTSFSSAGPTPFEHKLKPDLAAPGGEILSSTLPEFAGSPYAPFDGTSMATPHAAGAAALLVQRHPAWTPRQIKSALVSTAATAWSNTQRTTEASVLLAGSGLVNVQAADATQIFTDPSSLSFGDVNVSRGAQRRTLLLSVSDAGGGAGIWTTEVQPQSATSGVTLSPSALVNVPPGGSADVAVSVDATAAAAAGDDYGFLVLRRGSTTRRVPYAFFVTRPALQALAAENPAPGNLRRLVVGETLNGPSRVSAYRWPAAPFGYPPSFTGPPMVEDGAERLYLVPHLDRPVVNLGVAVLASTQDSQIDPWLLGAPDENAVQGDAATPVNVNALTFDYQLPIGAAAVVFPRLKRFWVAVDSSQDVYTGRPLRGRYLLRYWVNDLRPPTIRLLTRRVAAGRPTIAVRIRDGGAGVNPLSLLLAYRRVIVLAAAYDPFSGLAIFALPGAAPRLPVGRTSATLAASDYQEAKNLTTFGRNVMPNTRFRNARIRAVRGTVATWLEPEGRSCIRGRVSLLVLTSSTQKVLSVGFLDGRKRIAVDRSGIAGLYQTIWASRSARRGRHVLRAVVVIRGGRRIAAARRVRVCR
jgi:minor extracellular serine protease Vpr